MEQVRIVEIDADNNEQAGIDFWHVPGQDTYLYQRWEHKASGNVFYQTLPDPVCLSQKEGMSDLEWTVRECWLEQTDMVWKDRDEDYR